MKKFVEPMNRWGFLFSGIVFYLAVELYLHFGMFFDINALTVLPVMVLELLFVLIITYKRFLDISGKVVSAIVFSLTSVVVFCSLYLMIPISSTFNAHGYILSRLFLVLMLLYSAVVTLYLLFKKGKTPEKSVCVKTILKRTALSFTILSAFWLLTYCFFTVTAIPDFRMYPTLELQDKVLVSRFFNVNKLSRGDVVCVKSENGICNPLRVIGLLGENVKVEDGKIYINQKQFSDKFAFYSDKLAIAPLNKVVSPDDNLLLLMGDNRYYTKGGMRLTKDENSFFYFKSLPKDTKDVLLAVPKDEISGKIIAIHYYGGKDSGREMTSYVFSWRNKPFTFNQSSQYKELFGKVQAPDKNEEVLEQPVSSD